MNWKGTLRGFFGFDQLTYPGIGRMVVLVLAAFVCLAVAQIQLGLGLDIYGRASVQYSGSGLAAGESLLAGYLAAHPEDDRAYIQLSRARGRFERMARLLPEARPNQGHTPQAEGIEVEPILPPDYFEAFLDESAFQALLAKATGIDTRILQAYRLGDRERPEAALQSLDAVPGLQCADSRCGNLARSGVSFDLLADAGDLCRTFRQNDRAIVYYRAALELEKQAEANGGAERARRVRGHFLTSLVESGAADEFANYLVKSEFREAADPELILDYHLKRGEYAAILGPLVATQTAHTKWSEVVAALLVGAGWFVFLLHMGRGLERPAIFLPTALFAFALGVVSALLTLYVLVIQEHLFGEAGENRGIVFNLVNAIFGIGLREELLKLICALPLALILRKERDSLKIFTLVSIVGLGFAVAENVNYYAYGGEVIVGRFLTANFLHMTLTGYIGFYFVRAFQKKDRWENFSEGFFLMVLCHGLYDFFLIEPSLGEFSFLAYTVYIWISQKYLRLLVSLRPRRAGESSLTQVFLFALTTAVGAGYWQLARSVGFAQGVLELGISLLGVAVILIMFFREFDERVVRR